MFKTGQCRQQKHQQQQNKNTQEASFTKRECDYFYGWIKKKKKAVTYPKTLNKTGEPQRHSWERRRSAVHGWFCIAFSFTVALVLVTELLRCLQVYGGICTVYSVPDVHILYWWPLPQLLLDCPDGIPSSFYSLLLCWQVGPLQMSLHLFISFLFALLIDVFVFLVCFPHIFI